MGKKRLLIAGSLVALALGSGMYSLPQIATYQRTRTCKQYNLMIQSLPPYPKPLTRIQDLHNTEREKRLLVYSIEDTLHALKGANDQLDPLCNNLQTAEEVAALEKIFKENGLTNVWARYLWRCTDSDFNRLGDAEDEMQAARELHANSPFTSFSPVLPQEKEHILALLSRNGTDKTVALPLPFTHSIPNAIVGLTCESLKEFQETLYAKGISLAKKTLSENTHAHDAQVIETICGLAMIDAGTGILYPLNEKIALFGKTVFELNIKNLASQHYNEKEYIPAEAAAYLKAARTIAPTPMQALTLFMNVEDGLTGLDNRIIREYNASKNYASRTAAFKQDLLRTRRELFTEVNRFEATRTVLYDAKKNLAREENSH